MVEVTALVPVLVAVNAGKLPVPEATKPIEVLLLVQFRVVPVGGVNVKFVAEMSELWQIVIFPGPPLITGVGLTVTVAISDATQPLFV